MIEQTTQFVATHAAWAGPVVGLLCLGESLAIVGLFIPATAVMLAIGGLVGAGALEPWPILLWAVVGAIAGDWISYALGSRIGPSIYRRRPLNRHRHLIARARLMIRRYGFAAVFMGRFMGPVRATVPLVAGILAMPRHVFQIANVTSAVLWVAVMLAPGYFAVGRAEDLWTDDEGRIVLLGLLLGLVATGATCLAFRVLPARFTETMTRIGRHSAR